MMTKKFTIVHAAAVLATATLASNPALAAEYWLRAAVTTVNMPNPAGGAAIAVPMWGYASCTGATASTCAVPTVPGPALTVPAGDVELKIHLLNDLSTPTSIVINGLIKPMTPVWNDGATGNRTTLMQRVRSFDAEAAPAGSMTYTWPNVKPGTYLYQSGTQPQVQVQMGLYGAVNKNAVEADPLATTPVRAQSYAGAAYAYDNQATLLYSEIDPALHEAVATGAYGTSAGPTSTFSYAPKYFLINGQPYPTNAVIAPIGSPGTTLLRLLNAGLTTHVPMIQGTHWKVVAEDGKPYPYSSNQYTALLPAAKTLDVMLNSQADIGGGTSYAIMDRRMSLSNNGVSDGGMLAYLSYGAQGVSGPDGLTDSNQAPIPVADGYNSVKGVVLSVATPGVLGNDDNTDNLPQPLKAVAASGATTFGGTYVLHSNGSFSYTPAAGFVGSDSFSYITTDGKALSSSATVTINVVVPSAPTTLSALDDFDRPDAASLGTSSVGATPGNSWTQLATSAQPAPDVGLVGGKARANTTTLGGLAVLDQVLLETQGASISLATPLGNSALVLKATGGTAVAPANYVRVRCESGSGGEVVVATLMGGSNVSVFVKQAAFAAAGCDLSSGSLSAVVDDKGLVTTFLNGTFVGGVQLPDVGAWKGRGKIGLQLQNSTATVDNFSGGSL
jgi:FtsP/CotA-like multicopper oxidase with cupredoxin domain